MGINVPAVESGPAFGRYAVMAIAFSAALLRISRVEPFDCTICRRLRSANSRVTVSREVPIICAISSCVSASLRRGSDLAVSPFLVLHSSSSLASFSPAEWESPRARISRQALLYLSLSCSATRRQASLCSLRKRKKSSRLTKFTWHGSTVSAVNSYGLPLTVALRPSTSPGSAIFRIKVFPSVEQMESFTRPLHSTKMPRGVCPSTNRTAPLGYAVAYLMFSNDCSAAGGRSQKICSARILHARQLSMMSRPYGVSTTTPCTSHRIPATFGPTTADSALAAKTRQCCRTSAHRTLPGEGGHLHR